MKSAGERPGVVLELIELPLEDLARTIESDLERFVEGEPFADDRTLVMLRRTN